MWERLVHISVISLLFNIQINKDRLSSILLEHRDFFSVSSGALWLIINKSFVKKNSKICLTFSEFYFILKSSKTFSVTFQAEEP
jgi:hypothetical protein